MLQLLDLSLQIDGRAVLRDIFLTLKQGENAWCTGRIRLRKIDETLAITGLLLVKMVVS
ncbi:MAG: hypothetical protein ACMUEM_02510 [Flavobacteriales bacterium AspAUS03]